MKKFALFWLIVGCGFIVKAQPLKNIVTGDIGAGYTWPAQGYGVKPGLTFVLEPHYFASEYFSVGLRLEGSFLGYQAEYDNELFSFFGSTCFSGEFYFSRSGFRPFIGGGAGLFTRHYIFENDNYDPDEDDRLFISGYGAIKAGAFGRAGFEAGHLRFTGTYNFIADNFAYAAFTVSYVFGDY